MKLTPRGRDRGSEIIFLNEFHPTLTKSVTLKLNAT